MLQKSAILGAIYSTLHNIGMKSILAGSIPENIDTTAVSNYMDKNAISCMIYTLGELSPVFHRISPIPDIIYYQGNRELLEKSMISIVGPRKISAYGNEVIYKFFMQLREYDIVTVSGGAEGTDSLVHQLSIEYDIPTILVLGGGIGWYHQTGKYHFFQKVIENGGLIISEYPLFYPSQKYTFPQRNRLIAGLGKTLFLPEAGEKSGSLITVQKALQQGKKVYAPMGSIFSPASMGSNAYILQGKITPLTKLDTFLDIYYTRNNNIKSHIHDIIDQPEKISVSVDENSENISSQLIMTSMKEIGLL